MKIAVLNSTDPTAFLSRLFYLAWQACGGPLGMGFLQNRPGATEEEVFKNVLTAGDYACGGGNDKEVYGDYVFGRMMKFGAEIENGTIKFSDSPFRSDYQAFARKYPTIESLIDATEKSLGVKVELIA